jgi:hypothetical protein
MPDEALLRLELILREMPLEALEELIQDRLRWRRQDNRARKVPVAFRLNVAASPICT